MVGALCIVYRKTDNECMMCCFTSIDITKDPDEFVLNEHCCCYFCFIQQGKLACIAFLRHYIATKKPPKKYCSTNPNAGKECSSITNMTLSDAGPGDAGVTNETFNRPTDSNTGKEGDSITKSSSDAGPGDASVTNETFSRPTNPNASEEGDSITKSSSDAGPGDKGVTNETFIMDEEIPQEDTRDVNNRPSSDNEDKSDMDKEDKLPNEHSRNFDVDSTSNQRRFFDIDFSTLFRRFFDAE